MSIPTQNEEATKSIDLGTKGARMKKRRGRVFFLTFDVDFFKNGLTHDPT